MKKTVTLTILILLSFATMAGAISAKDNNAKSAFAAVSAPHIVVSGEVWLLNDNGDKLFVLPDTYYAKIINLDDNYYYVSFNGINGKVGKNIVSSIGYHTVAKGTTQEISVNEAFKDFASIKLKNQPSSSSEDSSIILTSDSFTFLGSYPANEAIWYYVKYNQYYGYIKQAWTSLTTLKIEPFVPEVDNSEVTTPGGTDEPNNNGSVLGGLEGKTLRIIIIVGLSIPAILIIILLFRPVKTKKYYEDD